MSKLTITQYEKLRDMGKEPIHLPADIFFGGDERLQKTPGAHHRPEFRKTGTYMHPSVVENRRRVWTDRAKRLVKGKMSEVELRKCGGLGGINQALEEFGIKLDPESMQMAEMHEVSLQQEFEAKKADREEFKHQFETKTGKKWEDVNEDLTPVNEKELLKAAATAATAQPTNSEENLRSITEVDDEDERRATGAPLPTNIPGVEKDIFEQA